MRDRLKRFTAFICACLLCFSGVTAFAESETIYSDWYEVSEAPAEGNVPADGTEQEPETSGEEGIIPAGKTVQNEYGTFTAISDVPEGTELYVGKYSPSEEEEAQARQMAGENAYLIWLDVSLTADGEKIETAAGVTLEMNLDLPEAPARSGLNGRTVLREVHVLHVMENAGGGTKRSRKSSITLEELAAEAETEDGQLKSLTFSTGSFSGFAIAYTVDFVYEGYNCSMSGNGWMTLSKLASMLHIMNRDGSALSMADVLDVAFTDPSLVCIEPVTETTSLAELRRNAGLAEGEPEESQTTVTAPNWVLFSLKPFTSREKLTITTRCGDVFVIDVTDAMGNISGAVTLTVDKQSTLSSVATTEKYFVFTAPFDHEYSFQFSNLSTSRYWMFTLYDEIGNEIDSQTSSRTTPVNCTWEMEAEHKYYIGVKQTTSSSSRTVYATPSYINHQMANHACTLCGYPEPWYIEDGVLHIQADEAMEFSSASAAPWYSRRSEITSIVVHEGVTKVPNYFVGNSYNTNAYPNLISVSLADSVKTINPYSFRYCSSLKTVELGTGITNIPDYAFYYCSGLESINLENVKTIGNYAFYNCSKLKNAYMDSATSIGNYAFCGCSSLENVSLENVKTIGSYAFYNCSKLQEAELGDELTTIGSYAFYNCAGIESVTIPGSVTSIGTYAFQNCPGLEEVRFSEDNLMTTLPTGIFQGCTSLAEVDLPQDLSVIGDSAFNGCSSLPEITFPSSLEKIGNSAFYGCTSLAEADLPQYLKSIGDSAFYNCAALEEVQFPSELTTIGNNAFYGCASFGSVTVPSNVTSLGTGVFQNCTGLEEADLSQLALTKLPDNTLRGCASLTGVELPDTLTEIGASAFNGCTALPEIQLPAGVSTIGNSAFSGCQNLTVINGCEPGEMVLPSSLTSIGTSAFQNCDAFVSVVVPDSVTSLGDSAFANCDNLESAEIGAGINQIPKSIFYNDPKLKDIVFKGNIEEIPDNAFYGCKSLVNFPLWEGLKRIGNSAFQNCTGLNTVLEFPSTLETIGNSTYQGCTQMTSVSFADDAHLTSIGSSAFSGLTNLRTVELPDTVKTIGSNAFYNCQNATFSGMPASLETIGDSAFYQCYGLTELHFPSSLKTIGSSAFYGNSSYSKIRSVTFAEGCELTTIGSSAFRYQPQITELVFPDKLTAINSSAFRNCTGLKTVELPESLTSIGNYAFRDCTALTTVDIPEDENLQTIGSYAFNNCSSLKSISLPDTVTSIGTYCFQYCYALENVKLSESLTSIPERAFYNCSSLKEVDIPDSVTSIGNYAFYGCTNLESVDFSENLTTIYSYAFYNCPKLEEAILPDKVATINAYAFASNQELKTVRIPPAANSLSVDILNNCTRLENLIWDVPSKEFTNLTLSNVPKFTLTLGKHVDSITDATLRALVGKGANLLAFEGENWLTLPSTSGLSLPRPQNNLEAGNYYADAQGALYQIKDGKATLVYVPDGLTSYTIPADIPVENGERIPVTGVKDNAFAMAQTLTSVTIADPGSMTRIAPFAFAYAANLESINGETTVSGATTLFTGTTPGVRAFYETKLTDDSTLIPLTGSLIYDAANDPEDLKNGWSDTLLVAISQSAYTLRGADGTRTERGPMDNDPDTNEFLAYTGEEVVTNVQVSNNASETVVQGDKVRVYFQLDDGGKLNYAVGTYPANIIQGGEVTGTVMVRVAATDAKGVFYVEFDRPDNGKTVSFDVKTNFASPTTGGGKMTVWAEYMNAEEASQTEGTARIPQRKHQTVDWTTKRNQFALTKATQTANVGVAVGLDGIAYIKADSFTIDLKRTGTTLEGVGRDNMKSAYITDTFVLPEGVLLNQTIIDEIRNNKIKYSGLGSSSITITSPTLGTIFTLSSSTSVYPRTVKLSLNELNQPVLTWRAVNPNPNYNENGAEMPEHKVTLKVEDKVFYLSDNVEGNKDYTITNRVVAKEEFCYSEDVEQQAESTYNVNSGSANMTISKSTASSGYRGASHPYTITLTSTGVLPVTARELTKLTDTIDSSDKMHYLDAAGIWYMFTEGQYPEALKLTIASVTLYGGAGSEALAATKKEVVTTDHQTAMTDQENTGYQTHYSKRTGSDEFASPGNRFEFTLENGVLHYQLKNSGNTEIASGTVGSAAELQAMFDAQGFFVTNQTTYTVEWDFANRLPDLRIPGGQAVTIRIPTRYKDTFMHLTGDAQEYDYNYTYNYTNTASATFNGSAKNASASSYHNNDFSFYKSRSTLESHQYTDEYTDLVIPDVVQYNVQINHSGSNRYDVLPVTDHMIRKQMLLVPVTGNESAGWATGLETRTVGEEEYYVLNREGTYREVWTGNAWADHVVVARDENNNYDTKIFWYLRDFGGTTTRNITYKAATIQNEVVPLTYAYDLYNESWLGDHDAHRLWDWVEDYGYYATEPLVLWWNKRIVDRVGDTSAGSDYCNVTQGKQVVYRFAFFNDRRKEFTIRGTDLYDVLPQYSSAFNWQKNVNIHIEYRGFETNDPNGEKWKIVTHNSSTMEQKIVWDDDFTMTCTDPNGIAYIYVIADFPEGTAWENYVQKYQNGTIYNTLFVRNNGMNFDKMSVSHDLADHLRARLQKGVYATGGETLSGSTRTDVYNGGEESRFVYDNDDTIRRKVYYYITLHNDGWTNLYLNPIQDILPKGFTLARVSLTGSNYATVTRGEGPSVSYVYTTYYSRVTSSTAMTEDGCQRVTFTIEPYTSNYEKQYNTRLGKYYLKPGQAVVLRVECYTNKIEDTQDIAINRATMPFYDFYNQGADIDSGTSTAVYAGPAKNDGSCELLDTTEAGALGFNTSSANAATEWLYSDVTVTRGEVQPGLLKALLKRITVTSDGVEEVENNPSSINPTDRLVWGVTAYDNSPNSIVDYAISDQLPSPFNFSRSVTFQQFYSNNSSSASVTLFNVGREVTEEADGRKIISDRFTLTPSGSDQSISATVNGGPVEVKIPNWNTNVSSGKQYLTLYVSISREGEDGDEVMSIRFVDEELCIPASGRVVLTYESENLSGVLQNKLLLNTAFVTPLKQNWDGTASEGNLTTYSTPYSEEFTQSVRNSAQIVASYGGMTSSMKTVKEVGTSNQANSEAEINYITVYDKEREFVYSLSVTNDNNDPIKKIVLIDNLPEKDDHTVFQVDDPRYSAFRVMLSENPAFTLTVRKDGHTTEDTVPSDNYRIELSTLTTFGAEDWKGTPSAQWTDLSSVSGAERQALIRNARSIRLVFEDNATNYFDNIFLPQARLTLSFTARIDAEDPNVQPGEIAWNGFGYHFTIKGRLIDQEAAPLVVGVRLPDYPNIRKNLINTRTDPYRPEYDETFVYLMYEGSKLTLSGTTAEDIIRTVETNKRNYVVVEVKVPHGSTGSGKAVSLNDRTGRMWNSTENRYEDKPWRMTDGKQYQLVEMPAERYTPYSWNGTRGTTFSFTYRANEDALAVTSVNMHDDWSLKLKKTDQFGNPVGGAVFAVYSPMNVEAWLQETTELEDGQGLRYTSEELQALYDRKTTADLKEAFGVELESKPDYVKTVSGTEYRLLTILKTPGYGTIQLDNLTGEHYLYQELAAPEHYLPDTTLYTVERGQTGAGAIVTVSVENKYIAEGTAQLEAIKQLSGRNLKEEEYTFRLEGYDIRTKTVLAAGDAEMPPMPQEDLTVANGADGSALFGTIALTQDDIGKTYYYQISEIIPGDSEKDPRIVYDGKKYIAKMTVRDLGDGKLGADISYSWFDEIGQEIASDEGAVFRNAYEDETEITLNVRKHLTGRPWREGETYTFLLEGVANPEDPEAPTDTRTFTVQTGGEDAVTITVPYNADYNEQVWYYSLREEISDAAIGYSRSTGKPIQAPKYPGSRLKVDLTYKRYREMSDEEKETLGLTDAGSIMWKHNGVAYDSLEHSVVVQLNYDESTGRMKSILTIDGETPNDQTQTVFTNRFVPDNTEETIPVAKTLTGRPWLRADQYTFTISAEDGVPMPAETEVVIERGVVNAEPVRTGKFTISFKWDDMKNADGTYATEKEFIYTIREKADPEAEGATVIRDADGNITSYKLDQITYDLHEEKVRILLKEQEGKMVTELFFLNDAGEWVQGEDLTTAFENTYATELIGFPVEIRKQFNDGRHIPETGSYSFSLLDSDENQVPDSEGNPIILTIDMAEAADGKLTVDNVDVKLGAGVIIDKPATYTFYLKEVIPDGAVAHDGEGDMLNSSGQKLVDGNGTPLTYDVYSAMTDAEKAALSLPSDFRWKMDRVIYDTGTVKLTVKITMNKVTYRLEPSVTYTPDLQNAGEALFSNYRTTEKIALQVQKKMTGRSFEEGEVFRFEILPESDGAPLRTENGRKSKLTADAGENVPAVFDSLIFNVEDLGDKETKDFSYRIHEVIPDTATAFDAQGVEIEDGEGNPLTYGEATPEQKASTEIHWYSCGITYAADQIVTIRVTLTTEGTLQVGFVQD